MIVEVIGGLISGSLALLADAGHMLSDAAALALAYAAFRVSDGVRPTPSEPSVICVSGPCRFHQCDPLFPIVVWMSMKLDAKGHDLGRTNPRRLPLADALINILVFWI